MDPPAGGSGSELSSDPNEQPDSSQPESSQPPASGDDCRQRGTEVDLWCAIRSSPQHPSSSSATLANASSSSVPDVDASLWQVGGSSSTHTALDEAATATRVPWCTDDQHDHQPHPICLSNIGSLHDSSTSSIPKFPGDSPNLCNIRDVNLGTEYRRPFPGGQTLGRQESLELLAESWAQLVPDEIEKYSQDELRHFQDDLEQFLFDSDQALLSMPPPGINPLIPIDNPETPNDESETMSSSVDTEGDAVVTSSGESPSGSVPSAGALKRKGPALEVAGEGSEGGATGATQQQQAQHLQSMDSLQKKLKGPVAERLSLPRTSRPRYAIQTRTEVDVIDDGYRWRKYGQKPVKNSAHPRNYYRCTTANCPVRKRVERSTENPSHVLTTYDGTHTHPETASTGNTHTRELNPPGNVASGNSEDVPLPAPVSPRQPVPLGPVPPRLPPSNYITPNIIGHLLQAGSQVPLDQSRRWSHPPQAGGTFFQRNLDLLRAHQIFRLQYGTQYPLLSNMLNLMRNFSRARPPLLDARLDPRLQDPRLNPRLDPRLDSGASLFAAQSYTAMRLGTGGQIHQDSNLGSPGAALNSQQQAQQQQSNLTSPSATSGAFPGTTSSAGPSAGQNVRPSIGPVSMSQRLLWLQELMGEGLFSGAGHLSQQPASDNSGAEKEGPEKNLDLGDPPA